MRHVKMMHDKIGSYRLYMEDLGVKSGFYPVLISGEFVRSASYIFENKIDIHSMIIQYSIDKKEWVWM